MFHTRCDVNANVTACLAAARSRRVGCDCRRSETSATISRIASTALPAFWLAIRVTSEAIAKNSSSTSSLTIRITSRPPERIWCTSNNRPTSAVLIPSWESPALKVASAMKPPSVSMVVTYCVVAAVTKLKYEKRLKGVTVLFIGVVKWSAKHVKHAEQCIHACDMFVSPLTDTICMKHKLWHRSFNGGALRWATGESV